MDTDFEFTDFYGLLTIMEDVSNMYIAEEDICIKVESTERQGIYRLRLWRCDDCKLRDGCELPQLAHRMSTLGPENPEKVESNAWKSPCNWLLQCLQTAVCKLKVPFLSDSGKASDSACTSDHLYDKAAHPLS